MNMKRFRRLVCVGLAAAGSVGLACVDPGPAAQSLGPGVGGPVVDAETRCAALADLVGAELIDLRIRESRHVAAAPAHCRVAGVIETEINFEVLLPDEWNGRFLMGGGGGYVGSVQNQAMTATYSAVGGTPLERGYATAGTDTGHVGDGVDAGWALNRPDRQENFGHRAVHLTAEASKSIIRHYYEEAPAFSYFAGCSRGGGQGMMASQRYPDDFDGIVSGAPAYHWTAFSAGMVQTQQAIYPSGDLTTPVITPDNLALLAAGIDAACDTLDGVDDDILTDPRRCGFRPRDLPRCEGAEPRADCVTDEQLAAIEAVYDGPMAGGEPLFFGFPFGGENDPGGWDLWVVDAEGARARGVPNLHYGFGTELYKNFVFSDPAWDYTRYDFRTWAEDTAGVAEILDATDTDLSAFRDRGGKILFWTGWSDLALTPLGTIDYYDRLRAADSEADGYARLYLLPGVLHCGGGPGPDRVDWVEALRAWVEDGTPPHRLVAHKLDDEGQPTMTRPACPYPESAAYRGGDPSAESSFACERPE